MAEVIFHNDFSRVLLTSILLAGRQLSKMKKKEFYYIVHIMGSHLKTNIEDVHLNRGKIVLIYINSMFL